MHRLQIQNPTILILDRATSTQYIEQERQFQQNLIQISQYLAYSSSATVSPEFVMTTICLFWTQVS
ncbi:hypothetical protein [Nostoc sp. C117]|uniref:hypothetical protein n=1 Tax=Nostoc sp. C117 TaxID=3349875 RepID=UPI00370D2BB3